jgi:hypothetical protein
VRGERRPAWTAAALIVGLWLLAFGVRTPLFHVLYEFAPGFDKFRGTSKFIFPASLFLALLTAMGFDRLLKNRWIERPALYAMFGLGAALGLAALIIQSLDWLPVLQTLQASNESYLRPQLAGDADFAITARTFAANSLLTAAATCLVLSGLLAWMRMNSRAVYAIAVLAVLEVFIFARHSRDTFDSRSAVNSEVEHFLKQHPGDYRIINQLNSNSALSTQRQDMEGDDPSIVRRYAEFAAFLEGHDPDQATQYANFVQFDPTTKAVQTDPLCTMLRLRFVFTRPSQQPHITESAEVMPHVALIGRYRVREKRNAIFTAMREPAFNPRHEVILEQEPKPRPADSDKAAGSARIIKETTDSLTIEADTPQPAILLITDVYTPSWQAVALPGSTQTHYDLMPANYVLRAVPLAAGHHRLSVEYRPSAFYLGEKISVGALLCFIAVFGWWLRATYTRRLLPIAN